MPYQEEKKGEHWPKHTLAGVLRSLEIVEFAVGTPIKPTACHISYGDIPAKQM